MRNFRDKAPFILLAFNLLLIGCRFLDVYVYFYKYLGDLVGYSIVTNLFMLSVYMNKKYCTSTKIAVIGLIALNILNLIWLSFGIDGIVYDFVLLLIIIFILITHKYKI